MAGSKRVNVAFTADTSGLQKGIQQANQALKLSRAQFEATTAGMQRWQTSTDGIRAKLTQLSSVQQAYTQKLNALRSQLQVVQSAYDQNSQKLAQLKAKKDELN